MHCPLPSNIYLQRPSAAQLLRMPLLADVVLPCENEAGSPVSPPLLPATSSGSVDSDTAMWLQSKHQEVQQLQAILNDMDSGHGIPAQPDRPAQDFRKKCAMRKVFPCFSPKTQHSAHLHWR